MRRLWPWAAVAAGGVLVGALAVAAWDSGANADLVRQWDSLERLTEELRSRQADLDAQQERLGAQAEALHRAAGHAGELTDRVLAAQGSAVERLKKVIAAVRQLRDELQALALTGIHTSQ